MHRIIIIGHIIRLELCDSFSFIKCRAFWARHLASGTRSDSVGSGAQRDFFIPKEGVIDYIVSHGCCFHMECFTSNIRILILNSNNMNL